MASTSAVAVVVAIRIPGAASIGVAVSHADAIAVPIPIPIAVSIPVPTAVSIPVSVPVPAPIPIPIPIPRSVTITIAGTVAVTTRGGAGAGAGGNRGTRIRQEVGLGYPLAQRECGNCSNVIAVIKTGSASWANHAAPEERCDVREGHSRRLRLVTFHRPLLDRLVNLPQIVNADILLRFRAGMDEAGDGNGRQ